ncbi:MAG TPA: winged helix-turn-helix domain-containing protein [Pyrinomonadaceae bacterium]|nr:winged helix-turn-helix domain-containing protein [Pyrinomonadaceae bacterium]
MAVQPRLIYEFDDFHLEPDERKLMRRDQLIPLHGKAFEMLVVLIRNRGRLLTKDELFHLVWPDQIVEESNLTVNMSAIRRALGERANSPRYITTVSGRGYRFTGDVRQLVDEALTIERESFARVTVQQEEIESTSLLPSAVQITKAARRVTAHPVMLCVIGGLVLTLAIGGLWLRRSVLRAATPLPWANLTMRRFTTRNGVPFRVAISPDGKSLVYMQHINDTPSLWLGQIETNSSVPIAEADGVGYLAMTFSHDGQSIYVCELDRITTATKLVRMSIIGGVPTQLAAHINGPVTISPDDRQLAFFRSGGGQTSIVVIDADGRNEHILARRSRPQNFSGSGISWSPDGKTIAVAASEGENGRTEVLAISLTDGSAQRIGKQDWGSVSNLAWDSDGHGLLLMIASSSFARRSEIWFVPFPAGEPRRITHDLNQYYGPSMSMSAHGELAVINVQAESDIRVAPGADISRARVALQSAALRFEGIDGLTWAPDGHLLYATYVDDAETIWEMNSDGSNRRQLTSSSADFVDRDMRVTSDNRFIVFQSSRSGNFQIWRANRDGSNLKQLTSGGTNSQPSLSPDGKSIVYVADRDGKTTLWRISIDGGEATQLTSNNASMPQVSPDGKHIAFFEVSDSAPHLAVISFDGSPEQKIAMALPWVANLLMRMCWTPDSKAIMYKNAGHGLWRQRLDADKPEEVKGFEDVQIRQLAWSVDGKNLAYTHSITIQEIILLQSSK